MASLAVSFLALAAVSHGAIDEYNPPVLAVRAHNHPKVILADPRVQVDFGPEQLVITGGLQPSLLYTKTGTIVCQSQVPEHSLPAAWKASHWAMRTVVSRDGGRDWTVFPLPPRGNGVNIEAGAIQLHNGTILALDTYVTAGPRPGTGVGQLYTSQDDWRSLQGPFLMTFSLPGINFLGSSDDGGRHDESARLHRRVLELPDGTLLTTLYGHFAGDTTPAPYMPTMRKCRVVLLRSADRGRHWDLVGTVAADGKIGTEGFDEPVLGRISRGLHTGRIICQMRTGQEMREAFSDTLGHTWSAPYVRQFADRDVYQTERWTEMFRGVKDKKGNPVVGNPIEMVGAIVDPDLVVLRSGVMVASFGLRIPPRACWPRAGHPLNGSYLAVSVDNGATWSHVIQMTSGVLTTHYTAIEEGPVANHLYLVYDLGDWRSGQGRCTYGRTVAVKTTE
jgi:hypothetical protein